MTTDVESLTVSVDTAGRMLGISLPTAYKLIHTGELPSVRLGKRILVPRVQIERLLNGQKDRTNDEEPVGI